MRFRPFHSFWFVPALTLGLLGCPEDVPVVIVKKRPVASRSANPGDSASSGVGGTFASGGATTSIATASPTPEPITPTPAPIRTAAPLVTVISIAVNPTSATLYPPAQVAATSLGLPTQIQFTASGLRSDGNSGGVNWLAPPGGVLNVSSTGLVTVSPNGTPSIYYVRVQSLDDRNVYTDIPVEVRSTGELDVTIN